jgi:hypothetical protein
MTQSPEALAATALPFPDPAPARAVPPDLAAALHGFRGLARAAVAQAEAALAAARQVEQAASRAVAAHVEAAVNALPAPDAPPSEHRRLHRFGTPAKIGTDPGLRTFVEARLDRRTYAQIAEEVAAHVPPARQVRKSAIHAWHRGLRARWSRITPNAPG